MSSLDRESERLIEDSQARLQRVIEDMKGQLYGSSGECSGDSGFYEDPYESSGGSGNYQGTCGYSGGSGYYQSTDGYSGGSGNQGTYGSSRCSLSDLSGCPYDQTPYSSSSIFAVSSQCPPSETLECPQYYPSHQERETSRGGYESYESPVTSLNDSCVSPELLRETELLSQKVLLKLDSILRKYTGKGINELNLWRSNGEC
uniref:Uncharacterized protein n=1 Tax=Cuerna arida TaxID=1464854 RepID=A0A1B6FXH8_9HEMI